MKTIDDSLYWDQYYQSGACVTEPSLFAQYVAKQVNQGETLVDLGCGNGRDAIYFAERGLDVTAIDLSHKAIAELQSKKLPNVCFQQGDVASPLFHQPGKYHNAYSRFSLHAMTEDHVRRLFQSLFQSLQPGGHFFIEVRSVHDPLFGLGEKLGRNAWRYDSHYRRFVVLEELVEELFKCNFHVIYAEENIDFAPFGQDNPPVIRVTAIKSLVSPINE